MPKCNRTFARWIPVMGYLLPALLPGAPAPETGADPVLHGTAEPTGTAEWRTVSGDSASVTLPPFPYLPNPTIVVDPSTVEAMAGDYCATTSEPSAEAFVFGYLPLTSFDEICEASPEAVSTYLGNLYLSGYFGGIWLRDSLDSAARCLVQPPATGPALPFDPPPVRTASGGDGIFRLLVHTAQAQLTVAQSGSEAAVLADVRSKLPGLLSLYGYNLGYTRFMLDNPPQGAGTEEDVLMCGDYVLDCDSATIELLFLDRFRPALVPLQHPYNLRWAGMDRIVQQYAAGSVQAGEAVWEDIMATSTLSTDVYSTLMDLSVGFLLVSDASALAGVTAWATQDTGSGRCALTAEAGLTVWSVSYFMGLISQAPEGTAISLTCQDTAAP